MGRGNPQTPGMRLRILMMADVPPDPNRGAAGTELRTAEELRKLGHDVDNIWAPDLGRRIVHGNLHLLLELPRAYEQAVLRTHKTYDIVHVNQPHGFRAARAVHRRWPNAAFIHRSHGFEPHVEEALSPWLGDTRGAMRRASSSALASLLRRHAFAIVRDADGHVVSSTVDAAYLRNRMEVELARIAVVPQAAPDAYIDAGAPPMNTGRLRRVLYVGQYAFVKAPAIVAAAMKRIAAAEPSVRFTWVCDRSHHSAVRDLLGPTPVELRHWMTQNELRDVYDAHGLFLFPSYYEGFGKAFLEAMSRGLCVVATRVGGMSDTIQDGVTGSLVEPGNAALVAARALALIRDFNTASAISEAAARRARELSWRRTATETAAFYRRMLQLKTRT